MEVAKVMCVIAAVSAWMVAAPVTSALDATIQHGLLAQAAPVAPVDWWERVMGMAFDKLGPLVLLGGYLWHNVTRTLPDKDKELAEARKEYTDALGKITAHQELMLQKVIDQLDSERQRSLEMVRVCEARRTAWEELQTRNAGGKM